MSSKLRYAFFDLDGTLISETSMASFLKFRLECEHAEDASQRWQEFLQAAAALRQAGVSRALQNVEYYRNHFAGARVDRLTELGLRWFEARRHAPGFWRKSLVARLNEHRSQGIVPVLLTGSFREVARAVASALDIDLILSAPLEENDGQYTGELTAEPMIGCGKACAIRAFVDERSVDVAQCFGYGDDESDIPFLEVIGFPHVVASSTPALLEHAARLQWPLVADIAAS